MLILCLLFPLTDAAVRAKTAPVTTDDGPGGPQGSAVRPLRARSDAGMPALGAAGNRAAPQSLRASHLPRGPRRAAGVEVRTPRRCMAERRGVRRVADAKHLAIAPEAWRRGAPSHQDGIPARLFARRPDRGWGCCDKRATACSTRPAGDQAGVLSDRPTAC